MPVHIDISCEGCGYQAHFEIRKGETFGFLAACPHCGSSDREFIIENGPEVRSQCLPARVYAQAQIQEKMSSGGGVESRHARQPAATLIKDAE
jgi:hypothetical protein